MGKSRPYLHVRPLQPGQGLDQSRHLRNDPAALAASGRDRPYTPEEWAERAYAYWPGDTPLPFLITLEKPCSLPSLVGFVAFETMYGDDLEISIVLHPDYRGQGLGKKILRFAMHYAQLNADNGIGIIARIKPDNIASQKVFAACGFELCREGSDDNFNLWIRRPV